MRTRSMKLAALLAAMVVVVQVGPASPAMAKKKKVTNTLTLTDVKGDANAINGQSREPRPWPGPGLGDHSGPIQKADSDIVSLALARTGTTTKVKGKKVFTCTGFTATMTLAAPVASDAHNRVTGVGVVNSLLWLRYQTDSSGTWSYITYSDGTSPLKGRYLNNAAKLDGNKIIFTVTESDLRAVGEKLASFKMSALGADTRTSTAIPDHPAPLDTPRSYAALAWDTMDEDSSKSFTPCA